MKKTIILLVAACMAATANARILRVSNVTGSSAPYSTFEAAQEAANPGDTIMLDASGTAYGEITINKQLVVIGAGYYLAENGIIQEGASHTTFRKTTINAEGTVLRGIRTAPADNESVPIVIEANKVVINRCHVSGAITLRNASNSIIHQNVICSNVEGYGSSYQESNIQITNNFIKGRVSVLYNSYIAYNTMYGKLFSCKDCTLEHNIVRYPDSEMDSGSGGRGLSASNNYITTAYNSVFNKTSPYDSLFSAVVIDEEVRSTYGAFAGDSPYVLSGVPSGPIIEDMIVPTTVEKGSKMQVTIKVGIQK